MTIGGMTYTTKNAIHVTTLVTSSTTRFYGHEASRSLVCLVMRCKARWPKMIVWVVVNIKGLRVTSRCPASRNAAAPSSARLSFFDTFKNEKFSKFLLRTHSTLRAKIFSGQKLIKNAKKSHFW